MAKPNSSPPTGGPTRSFIASSVDPRRPAARSRSPEVHGRRDHRHAGGVDDRFGRCQHRRDDEDHPDRHLVEEDHCDEAGHHDGPRHVQTHPQHAAVVAIGPRTARKDEEQPRQALGHRHAGDQTGVVGHRRGEQRQRDEPETVAEVRQRGRTPQQPEVARKRGTEPAASAGRSTAPVDTTVDPARHRRLGWSLEARRCPRRARRVPCRSRRAESAMLPGLRLLSELGLFTGCRRRTPRATRR